MPGTAQAEATGNTGGTTSTNNATANNAKPNEAGVNTDVNAKPTGDKGGVQSNTPTGDKGDAKSNTPTENMLDAKGEASESAGAPEKYNFSLPEGFEAGTMLEDFGKVAKELNLPNTSAQKIVDFYAATIKKGQADFDKENEEWKQTIIKDAEIGGAKLTESKKTASLAFQSMFPVEVRQLLVDYGIVNHPAFFKSMVNMGKTLKTDTVVTGQQKNTPTSSRGAFTTDYNL